MDEYTDAQLLELEQYYLHEEEANAVDGDMEVWLCTDFYSDEEIQTDDSHSETNRIHVSNQARRLKKGELKNIERKSMVDKLLLLSNGKNVPKGAQQKIAEEFKVHRTTVWRIWSRAQKQMRRKQFINVDSMKKGRVGRKPKEWDFEKLKAVPVEKRTTIRALANALDMGCSAVYRLIKAGKLRAHSNSIKPTVSQINRISRMKFILSQIVPPTVKSIPKFSAMYNVVHIDEKWFYMSQQTQRFYLFPWEDDPYRACQNKKFIAKVMFMAAVARPHIGVNGEILWDGKIGIFPFTEIEFAKRSSKNRDKGTPETKAIQSITKEVIRAKLINHVLPAIRSNWPVNACKEIWIQQDNARPHISADDVQFKEAATVDGFNISLTCQPAQSPDLNVLDLGFFRAIQSLQYKSFPSNVDELVDSVENAFNAFDTRSLNYTWLHLQYCMIEILGVKGGNNYKNPHKGKMQMDRLGILPTQVAVPMDTIEECISYVRGEANSSQC